MFDDETIDFRVVMNDEEQYSIWPADRDLPNGWSAVGEPHSKEECLAYIEEVWVDMRPKSLRLWMEQQATGEPASA